MSMDAKPRQTPVTADTTLLQWDGAPSEVQSSGPAFRARTELVRRTFQQLRPTTLLDIGCGRGNVTAIAARFARSVYAIDLAPEAIRETRARLESHGDAHVGVANVLTGDWGDLPRPAEPFDAILLSEVLEHLDDDAGMLAHVRSMLKPGGHLVATVPAKPELWTAWDDLAGHVRRYTKPELISKLDMAGFEVCWFRCWGFPISGWLAIRGAKMRGARVARRADGEVPSLLARAMPLASVPLALLARMETMFASLDLGAGYVVVARRRD